MTRTFRKPLRIEALGNALAVALGLLLLAGFAACDEGSDITYVNMTDKTLEVYINDLLEVTLEPHETRGLGMIRFSLPRLFEAKHQDGTVVFSETLTWEDLKAREFRLAFTDAMAP